MIHQSHFDYIFSCKHVLLIALLLSASLPVFSQTAIIKGYFEGANAASILIGIPIDGQFYNKDMMESLEVAKITRTFRKEISLKSPSLIPIKVDDKFVDFYLEPGKELNLLINKVEGTTIIKDRSPFGEGNALMNTLDDSRFLEIRGKRRHVQLARYAERFYEKSASEQTRFLDSCKIYHAQLLKPWNDLRKIGKLTDKQYLMGYIALTNAALALPFYIFVHNIKKYEDLNEVQREMYRRTTEGIINLYGPTELLSQGTNLTFYLSSLSMVLSRKQAGENANEFSSLSKSLARYALLPEPFDRWLISNSIQGDFRYGFKDYTFKDFMAIYERHYPKDGLYYMLDSLNTIAEGKRIRYTDGLGLYPDSLSTYKFYYENGLPTVGYVANFSSFESVLATSSRSKAVFVDLWATWCEPCIRQFAHSKELTRRLRERNIFTVYLSIDSPDKRDVWEYTVRGHALEGSHVLLSPELRKELKQKYQLNTIPRYMLATAEGRVLIPDVVASPSDMDALMSEIDAFLKTE